MNRTVPRYGTGVIFVIVLFLVPLSASADQREPQVQLETKIVEVNQSQARDIGVDYDNPAHLRGLERVGQPGNFQQPPNAFDFNPMNFAAGQGTQNVLSTPKIVTLNNEPAKVTPTPSIPLLPASPNDDAKPLSGELQLETKPVVTDDGRIKMRIEPRKTTTLTQINDGQTAVLGGLKKQPDDAANKVPLLGQIPFLGQLFKNSSNQNAKENLTVFVTPTIAQTPDHDN